MNDFLGTSGLILNEPLLWEKGKKGRRGMSMAEADVPAAAIAPDICGEGPDFPDLSEVDVVRHYTRLSQWNYGVDTGLYPLGSCTMKYNPKINDKLAATPEIAAAHPMLGDAAVQGALRIIYELQEDLAAITGMDAVSVQPSAGAQGELAGMLIFAAYHRSRGSVRTKILIPDTAHGTNPASAALCGFRPVSLPCNAQGVLDVQSVAERSWMRRPPASCSPTPTPSGFSRPTSAQIAEIVHAKGGLVYGDGANMNAIMGIVDIKKCGVDVMHLNLHKTFSTPHGGGGPGAGPVCVVRELESVPAGAEGGQGRRDLSPGMQPARVRSVGCTPSTATSACWSGPTAISAAWARTSLKKASQLAVLNANYIKERLKGSLHLAL